MDAIRAILALVPIMGLKICQLDIKGAYLNGILKEKVYMKQPEGYEDGTDRICELLKTCQRTPQSTSHYSRHLRQSPIHPSTQTTYVSNLRVQPTCPTYVSDLRVRPTWLAYVSTLRVQPSDHIIILIIYLR